MDGFTPEERTRATLLVHQLLLTRLWEEHLSKYDEPIEEAAAIEQDMLWSLDTMLGRIGGRDADVFQLAIAQIEGFWTSIRATLEADAQPIEMRPTEHGWRLWEKLRGESPPEPGDDKPDQ